MKKWKDEVRHAAQDDVEAEVGPPVVNKSERGAFISVSQDPAPCLARNQAYSCARYPHVLQHLRLVGCIYARVAYMGG